jgi:hypothetical protein
MRDQSTAIVETTSHVIRHANLLYPALLSPHSHSIVRSHRNALNSRRKFFLHTTKNRLPDPSEIRALDFKHEFRRSAICSVSATIAIDWSILLELFREAGVNSLPKKTVSDGESLIRP